MSKVKIKNMEAVFKKIRETLGDIEQKTLEDIGQFAADRIRGKARSGKTMYFGLGEREIKKLKPSTIKRREAAIKDEKEALKDRGPKGDVGRFVGRNNNRKMRRYYHRLANGSKVDPEFFEPKKSNLTFTGQFLESIRVMKAKGNKVEVGAGGPRKDDKITNSQLAKYLADGGRPIFGLDDTSRKRIKQMVLEYLKRKLAQNRLRKK